MNSFCSIISSKSHYKTPFSCQTQHHGKNKQLKLDGCEKTTTVAISLVAGILFPVIGGVLALYGLSALYKHRKIKKLNDSKVDFVVNQTKWTKAPKSDCSHSLSSSDSTPKPDDQKPKVPAQLATTFQDLPIELKSEIFSYLPQYDRLQVERVCKAWQKDMTQVTFSGISREAKIAWDNLMDIFVNNSLDRSASTHTNITWTLSVYLEEDTGLVTAVYLSGRDDDIQIAKPNSPVREYKVGVNFVPWVCSGKLAEEAYHLTMPVAAHETLSDVVAKEMLIQLNYSANLIWKNYVEKYKKKYPDAKCVAYRPLEDWGDDNKLVPYPIDKNKVAQIRKKRLRVASRLNSEDVRLSRHPRKNITATS